MYFLEEKLYFLLLFLIPLLFGVYLWELLWRKKQLKQFSTSRALDRIASERSVFKPNFKFIVLSFSILFIVFALVNLRFGTQLETVKREGLDIIFAIDVSKSMDAEDVAPSRIYKAKQIVSSILEQLGGDRIGLIAYAGRAFPQMPITSDYSATKTFLNAINTNQITSRGTAIGEAIRLSKQMFGTEPTSKVLVILSDGEDHQGGLSSFAEDLAQIGAQIITIGIGTEQGGPIPIYNNGTKVVSEYKKDRKGDIVMTKLNKQNLEQLASIGNGAYLESNSVQTITTKFMDSVKNLDKKEFESVQYSNFKSQYHWSLLVAIALLILDLFVFHSKTKWLKKINLFDEH